MFSVQYFRELISDRLTVAALDIFAEFEKTIMQYEEAMERQRRLLTALRRKPATAPQLCPAGTELCGTPQLSPPRFESIQSRDLGLYEQGVFLVILLGICV